MRHLVVVERHQGALGDRARSAHRAHPRRLDSAPSPPPLGPPGGAVFEVGVRGSGRTRTSTGWPRSGYADQRAVTASPIVDRVPERTKGPVPRASRSLRPRELGLTQAQNPLDDVISARLDVVRAALPPRSRASLAWRSSTGVAPQGGRATSLEPVELLAWSRLSLYVRTVALTRSPTSSAAPTGIRMARSAWWATASSASSRPRPDERSELPAAVMRCVTGALGGRCRPASGRLGGPAALICGVSLTAWRRPSWRLPGVGFGSVGPWVTSCLVGCPPGSCKVTLRHSRPIAPSRMAGCIAFGETMKLPVVIYLPAETTTQTNVRWRDDFGSKARVARRPGAEHQGGAEAAQQQRKEFGFRVAPPSRSRGSESRLDHLRLGRGRAELTKASPDAAELFKSAGLKGPPMPVEPVGEFEG